MKKPLSRKDYPFMHDQSHAAIKASKGKKSAKTTWKLPPTKGNKK
jgi:hypothetical protein